MTSRDPTREVLAAYKAGDIESLVALALEFAKQAEFAAELERRDAERKRMRTEQKRAERARKADMSRDVARHAATSLPVARQPLARIKDQEPLKAVKSTTNKPHNGGEPSASPFGKADCDALYERWSTRRGGIKYPVFRTALLPLYPASGPRYQLAEVLNALDAFAEAASAAPPEYGNLWTPAKLVADITRWVRLGKLPLVDEWGEPTERGRAAKLAVGQ